MSDHEDADRAGRPPAPALELTTADGEPFSLAALGGLPVLVSFLSHAA